MFQEISKCPILKGLEYSDLEHVFSGIKFNIKRYEKDDLIMNSGETCNFLMIFIDLYC